MVENSSETTKVIVTKENILIAGNELTNQKTDRGTPTNKDERAVVQKPTVESFIGEPAKPTRPVGKQKISPKKK